MVFATLNVVTDPLLMTNGEYVRVRSIKVVGIGAKETVMKAGCLFPHQKSWRKRSGDIYVGLLTP